MKTKWLTLKIIFFKSVKFFAKLPIIKNIFGSRFELYKRKFGSSDYRNANEWMRAILVKVVNEDISEFLPLRFTQADSSFLDGSSKEPDHEESVF